MDCLMVFLKLMRHSSFKSVDRNPTIEADYGTILGGCMNLAGTNTAQIGAARMQFL